MPAVLFDAAMVIALVALILAPRIVEFYLNTKNLGR